MAFHCLNVDECNHYSDLDIYFSDGTSGNYCHACAWEMKNDTRIEQIVPQHGSDNVNRPVEIKENDNE